MMSRRYWFIYHKKETDQFYAYTDDKKILKKFKTQRDTKQFYFLEKWLDKKEISELARDFQRRILIDRKIISKGIGNQPVEISIIMSQIDNSILESYHNRIVFNSEYIFAGEPINYRIFKPDIQNALIALRYKYFSMIKKGDVLIADDATEFIIDDLQMFLKIQYDHWTMYETFILTNEMGDVL